MGYKYKIKNESKEERLWKKVKIRYHPDGSKNYERCWLFTGSPSSNGYGEFKWHGETIRAHRLALESKLGRPIGEDLCAAHVGDCNKLCCNPEHLYETTIGQNIKDAWANDKVPPRTAAQRRALSKKLRGQKRSPEVKALMSLVGIERWERMTPEEKAEQLDRMMPEWRRLGKGMPKRQRNKISKTMMGHPVSAAAREKMSRKRAEYWAKKRAEKAKLLEEQETI